MNEYLYCSKYNNAHKFFFNKYIIKFLILVVVTLILLIILKTNKSFRSVFYKNIYEKHFSFVSINNYYQKLFGNPIPFSDFFTDSDKTVFSEKIKYDAVTKYYDGYSFTVNNNLLVPVIETGMVIFIGEKENLGNTIIIEQIDGTEVWYGNITDINVKMYDYIEKGSVLGNTISDKLYLVFKKDGESISYEKYL